MTHIQADPPRSDLVDCLESAGGYSTLLAALGVSGVEATLRGEGPYTLFAPQDEAFEKFPKATLAKLMRADHRDLLTTVLSYHFAPGQVLLARFRGKRIAATSFEGRRLRIDGHSAAGVFVDKALVIQPDVLATNGVLHGINRVLWPKFAVAESLTA